MLYGLGRLVIGILGVALGVMLENGYGIAIYGAPPRSCIVPDDGL